MLASFRVLCILFLAGVTGCASTAHQSHSLVKGMEHQLTPETAKNTATHYLALADYSAPPRTYTFNLYAVDMLLRGRLTDQAAQLLEGLPDQHLLAEQRSQKILLSGILAWQQHRPNLASKHLDKVSLKQLPRYLHAQYYQTRAAVEAQRGKPLSSAKAFVSYVEREHLDGKIAYSPLWRQLNSIPTYQLQKMRPSQDEAGGWLALNQVSRQSTDADFSAALHQWQQVYSRHPARKLWVPHSYRPIAPPQQVALLLPLTGAHAEEAQAIRDGFIAAYYSASQIRPAIRLYDTSEGSVTSLYKQAVNEGAALVIGPLTKPNVKILAHAAPLDLPVPVIALNTLPEGRPVPERFYQFTLSPNDEAHAVAERVFEEGYRNAAVIAPRSALGDRLMAAFNSEWIELGGKIPAKVQYDPSNDPAVYVRQLLNVDVSQERTASLRRLLQRKVHNQARRREDIDVFILMAPEEDARQLRPLFDFYYAEDIPVYAPTLVYSGLSDPKKDRDLNGINFCDLPWILDPKHPLGDLRTLISTHWEEASQNHIRLFALGIDAYLLTTGLHRLESYPDLGFPGSTGILSLSPNHQIAREMTWAQMAKGAPALRFKS